MAWLIRSFTLIALVSTLAVPCHYVLANPLSDTKLSGFMTASVSTSNNPTPLFLESKVSDQVNFIGDTVLGIQIDSVLDEKTRFSCQIIARDSKDEFDLNAEWLYIAHSLSPHVELRAGRLRTPIYLYSDTIYVGVTYPWVRTPEEVYSLFATITRYTGMDLNYDFEIANTNNNVHLFVGAIKEDLNIGDLDFNFESKELYGLELTSTTLNNHLRVMLMQIRVAEMPGLPATIGTARIYAIADRFSFNQIELIAEYAYRVIPGINGAEKVEDWGWYGTLAYTKNDYTPYITFALRDASRTIPLVNYTRDAESVTIGSKYYLNPSVATKFELQYSRAKQNSRGLFTADPGHKNALIATLAITAKF